MHPINGNEFFKTVVKCTFNCESSLFSIKKCKKNELSQLKMHATTVLKNSFPYRGACISYRDITLLSFLFKIVYKNI